MISSKRASPGTMRAILQGIAGIAVGAVLLWLALRDTNIDEIQRLVGQIQVRWVFAALACYAVDITLRVQRWHILLRRLVAVPWYGVGEILIVGYAVNNVLPARLGELFRADYAKRRCGLTRSAVLGTIVIERLCDGFAVVFCLAGGLVLLGASATASDLSELQLIALTAGGGLFCITAALLAVIHFGKVLEWLPAFLVRHLTSLTHGTKTFTARTAGPVIGLTVVIWIVEALAIWSIVRAIDLEMNVAQGLVLIGAISLGTLVPTAPAYVGSYQFVFALVFVAFGWAASAGIVAATVTQFTLMLPLTLLGLLLTVLRSLHGMRA